MPMTREEHEALLNDLLDPALEQSARTEKLQQLRVDYGSVLTDDDTQKKSIEKLTKDNSDLVVSNSKLFRQIGLTDNEDKKKEEQQKTFSETVTLSQIEGKK